VPAVMESCTLPPRCNSAMQVVGSATCGAFVLFWIEQAVRVHCRGESPCSMKWPRNDIWGDRLHSTLNMLKAMQDNAKKEVVLAALKAVALKEKAAKLDQGKANTEKNVAAACVHLAARTRNTHNGPRFRDMPPNAQQSLRNRHDEGDVGNGCHKCNWLQLCKNGCLGCVLFKAARHELKKEKTCWNLNPAQMETAIAQCLLDVRESCTEHLQII
jgi:radical SAM protein with 4Fe4S-binding SPASM domain